MVQNQENFLLRYFFVIAKVIHQKYRISYDEITNDLCPILSVQQLYRICTLYWDDNYNTRSVSPDVIAIMRVLMTEDSNSAVSSSFLLDDNSSYEDGDTILSKVSSAADFIWSEAPLDILGSVTTTTFEDTASLPIKDRSLTTEEDPNFWTYRPLSEMMVQLQMMSAFFCLSAIRCWSS